ncbi:mif-1 [Pristionchus pacificus]|uniref:L-dopachrome isomerase n=1 Tax=Pristionchus pacificus TaxID=54126 RepID=A0A454XY01_PRIPA|nr:mif-1 [Pristionchus pacificus]|eukprot:PDM65945.1 mif-1 [Pristionchus pacificus]
MPVFTLSTNVPSSKISDAFISELSSKLADLLHKPESYVAVHVIGDQKLSFGGDGKSPAGSALLKSIGSVGTSKQNNDIAKVLHPLIEKNLGIKQDRLYIEFVNLAASAVSHNGQTFG